MPESRPERRPEGPYDSHRSAAAPRARVDTVLYRYHSWSGSRVREEGESEFEERESLVLRQSQRRDASPIKYVPNQRH